MSQAPALRLASPAERTYARVVDPDPSPLPETIGPYRVLERLASGGMGEVYRGYDRRLDRPVALKKVRRDGAMSHQARRRLRHEAQAIAQLSHPAIVQVHDWVETDDGDWFVMELVSGSRLTDVLGRVGALDPRTGARLGAQIASALACAHDAGIVHRDLKADNVMLTEGGNAKILDFGIAKRTDRLDGDSLTAEGHVLGTLHAMSPEQAMSGHVDQRSDLFSFGSLLYEMLTGESPFRSVSPVQTLGRICSARQKPVHELSPRVSAELSALVDHLLEKLPENRPASAAEVRARLLHITGDEEGESLQDDTLADPALRRREPSSGSSVSPQTRERRELVLLAADLVGGDGGDDLFEAMPAFQELTGELLQRFGGYPLRRLGHRLLACFGFPEAHPEDARRAVDAALELLAAVGGLGASCGIPGLGIGIVLDIGLGVVLAENGQQEIVFGTALDRAVALRQAVEPGRVWVTGRVARRLASVVWSAPEPVRPAGSAEPVEVFALVRGAA